MQSIKTKDRLIVALDTKAIKEAKALVEELGDLVSFYKIGFILAIQGGASFIKWLIKRDKKVFLDLKCFDIEETIERAVENISKMGVSFLTIHGNKKVINAACCGRGKSNLKILAVSVLTSLDAYDIRELGFPCSTEELVLFRAMEAVKAGCDGIVAPGSQAKLIRKAINDKLLIVSPGIRPFPCEINSHKMPVTPYEAIINGADYLVVGRPIITAKDPHLACKHIFEEIERALKICQ